MFRPTGQIYEPNCTTSTWTVDIPIDLLLQIFEFVFFTNLHHSTYPIATVLSSNCHCTQLWLSLYVLWHAYKMDGISSSSTHCFNIPLMLLRYNKPLTSTKCPFFQSSIQLDPIMSNSPRNYSGRERWCNILYTHSTTVRLSRSINSYDPDYRVQLTHGEFLVLDIGLRSSR